LRTTLSTRTKSASSSPMRDRQGAGVRVRLLYDWLGGLMKTSRSFWSGSAMGRGQVLQPATLR
jgi:hypothetical protein